MIVIICDAGPIIHLQEADLLELLKPLGQIKITKTIYKEITAHVQIKNEMDKPSWTEGFVTVVE